MQPFEVLMIVSRIKLGVWTFFPMWWSLCHCHRCLSANSEEGFVITVVRHKHIYTDTDLCWRSPQCQGKVTAVLCPAVSLLGMQSSKASLPVCLSLLALFLHHISPVFVTFWYKFNRAWILYWEYCVWFFIVVLDELVLKCWLAQLGLAAQTRLMTKL